MNIVLYTNSSVPNMVTKQLTQVHSVTGTLRAGTSMLAPTFVLTGARATLSYNYFKVTDWDRYYFLGPVEYTLEGVITISGVLDPLMSFADDIRSARAIVERQEFVYNMYLNDGNYLMRQDCKHKVVAFPNSFNDFSYILALAGNGQSTT